MSLRVDCRQCGGRIVPENVSTDECECDEPVILGETTDRQHESDK